MSLRTSRSSCIAFVTSPRELRLASGLRAPSHLACPAECQRMAEAKKKRVLLEYNHALRRSRNWCVQKKGQIQLDFFSIQEDPADTELSEPIKLLVRNVVVDIRG